MIRSHELKRRGQCWLRSWKDVLRNGATADTCPALSDSWMVQVSMDVGTSAAPDVRRVGSFRVARVLRH